MKRTLSAALAACICTLSLCSCSLYHTVSEAPDVLPETDPKVADPSWTSEQERSAIEKTRSETEEQADRETISGDISAFSAELFNRCSKNDENGNTLVSPYSVYTALAMLQNGAVGDTQNELISVLGCSPEALNNDIHRRMKETNRGGVMDIANAMFVIERDDVTVTKEFIDTIKKRYFAELFNIPFDEAACGKINAWAKKNTHDMIPTILTPDAIDPFTVAVLLNAIAFEGKWEKEYEEYQVYEDTFTAADKKDQTVPFLHETSEVYVEGDNVTGFVKYYEPDKRDNRFCFVGLLPSEGTSAEEYAGTLTGDTLKTLMDNCEYCDVITAMPKFKFDCSYSLPAQLKAMGINTVFDEYSSDLSALAETADGYNLYVSDVIHKTHIEVDEKGTKAAAATAVIIEKNDAVMVEEEPKRVILDRPFVFAIYDLDEEIPVFLGVVNTVEE